METFKMDWSEVAHLFSFVSGVGLIVVGALADTEPVLSVIGNIVGLIMIIVGAIWWCCGIPPFLYELLRFNFCDSPKPDILFKQTKVDSGLCCHLIYRDEYNITACGLEKMHPFDSCKYGRVIQFLEEKGLINRNQLYSPPKVSTADLLMVHSRFYLASLHSAWVLTKIIEVPIILILPVVFVRRRLLTPMQYQVGGTILGGIVAVKTGYAINIGGGFHHASAYSGGGFCVYADITICIQYLRKYMPDDVNDVMIIDLDAHQGNGHERDFMDDPHTYILDFYNPRIYPGDMPARRAIKKSLHYQFSDANDSSYLRKLKEGLKEAFEEFSPSFIVYNAGTDCMINDPLGGMALTPNGILQRDEMVFQTALNQNIPILMVLSGGYQMSNAQCIADSIANLHEKFHKPK